MHTRCSRDRRDYADGEPFGRSYSKHSVKLKLSSVRLILQQMNPFVAFCLYVAARVFVQYLKSRPEDQSVRASLDFLLGALRALKRINPLAESFLVQLDVDLGTAEETNLSSRFSSSAGQSAVRTAVRALRSF